MAAAAAAAPAGPPHASRRTAVHLSPALPQALAAFLARRLGGALGVDVHVDDGGGVGASAAAVGASAAAAASCSYYASEHLPILVLPSSDNGSG